MSSRAGHKKSHPKEAIRAPQACINCKKRHGRCSGEKPSCRQCVQSGKDCSYAAPQKRGPKPRRKLDPSFSVESTSDEEQLQSSSIESDGNSPSYFIDNDCDFSAVDESPDAMDIINHPSAGTKYDTLEFVETVTHAFLRGIGRVIPHVYDFSSDKSYYFWMMLRQHPLDLDQIGTELCEMFLAGVVFAHGCRAIGEESLRKEFESKSSKILQELFLQNQTSELTANIVACGLLLEAELKFQAHDIAHGAVSLHKAIGIAEVFGHVLLPQITVRVYGSSLAAGKTPQERYRVFMQAKLLGTDANTLYNKIVLAFSWITPFLPQTGSFNQHDNIQLDLFQSVHSNPIEMHLLKAYLQEIEREIDTAIIDEPRAEDEPNLRMIARAIVMTLTSLVSAHSGNYQHSRTCAAVAIELFSVLSRKRSIPYCLISLAMSYATVIARELNDETSLLKGVQAMSNIENQTELVQGLISFQLDDNKMPRRRFEHEHAYFSVPYYQSMNNVSPADKFMEIDIYRSLQRS
eukprot:TRINITY_DN885_c0_g1_i3.p1 TRINITY_DN885_c0_g1~~TRINITY_DN885_c0_g1_i3.p1  ORF type:complete len:519 (+),score=59.25 TRINITY_DN885_c0_g1_i3:88-1644(+)